MTERRSGRTGNLSEESHIAAARGSVAQGSAHRLLLRARRCSVKRQFESRSLTMAVRTPACTRNASKNRPRGRFEFAEADSGLNGS